MFTFPTFGGQQTERFTNKFIEFTICLHSSHKVFIFFLFFLIALWELEWRYTGEEPLLVRTSLLLALLQTLISQRYNLSSGERWLFVF